MKKFLLVFPLLLTGCDEGPRTPVKDNAETSYQFNGTIEGCHLYRVFPQHGSSSYHLAICPHADSKTSWEERSGKTSYTREVEQKRLP